MTSNDLTRFDGDGAAVPLDIATPLRPALLAPYLDLDGLRHDFPLVLVDDPAKPVITLTGVVDALLTEIAPRGAQGERLRQHVLRLEEAIRRRLDRAAEPATLLAAWDGAGDELLREGSDPESLRASLATARDALRADGALLRCEARAPVALVRHLRSVVERPRAAAFRDELAEIIRRLGDMLTLDERWSERGQDPERLRAAVGTMHQDDFDFGAWSELLRARPDDTPLPGPRRTRIEWALGVLRDQRFVVGAGGETGETGETYAFEFDSCTHGLDAYRERMPELARLVKAIAIARLELDNAYDPAVHDPVFHTFDAAAMSPDDLVGLPGTVIVLDGGDLDQTTCGQVLDVLASALPFTILILTADAIGPPSAHDPLAPRRLTGVELVNAAVGLGTARVVQTTVAAMAHASEDIRAALEDAGPALVHVVTGPDESQVGLPRYLATAAAAEARAVPIFSYDPGGGPDWADRVTVSHTPQPATDWPVHVLEYEDEQLQRVREDVAFTVADLLAADSRFADHVAVAPRRRWTDAMIPVADFLQLDASDREGHLPYVLGVGQDDVLRRTVVDERIIGITEQRLASWRRLQELAGTREAEERRRLAADRAAPSSEVVADPAGEETPGVDATSLATVEPPPEPPPEPVSTDDAWIETARCTTCDECTNLNPRMFAYNEDKQAYIADRDAGSFRDLVQAAESCQVSIIHPGEPWDAGEPGLDDLRRRAAAFT